MQKVTERNVNCREWDDRWIKYLHTIICAKLRGKKKNYARAHPRTSGEKAHTHTQKKIQKMRWLNISKALSVVHSLFDVKVSTLSNRWAGECGKKSSIFIKDLSAAQQQQQQRPSAAVAHKKRQKIERSLSRLFTSKSPPPMARLHLSPGAL